MIVWRIYRNACYRVADGLAEAMRRMLGHLE